MIAVVIAIVLLCGLIVSCADLRVLSIFVGIDFRVFCGVCVCVCVCVCVSLSFLFFCCACRISSFSGTLWVPRLVVFCFRSVHRVLVLVFAHGLLVSAYASSFFHVCQIHFSF